jgi:hypothetical protein
MRETRIEKEVEICATNLANKTKCTSTNPKSKNPVILSVILHRQNPVESTAYIFQSEIQ